MTGLKKTQNMREKVPLEEEKGGGTQKTHPFMCRKVKIFLVLICVKYFPCITF